MHTVKLVGHCFSPDQTAGSTALLESAESAPTAQIWATSMMPVAFCCILCVLSQQW